MIGDRVRNARKAKNLTQSELARRIGQSQQNIQQLESGKVKQPRYLYELSEALDVSFDWLMGKDRHSEFRATPEQLASMNIAPGPHIVQHLPLISWVQAGARNETAHVPESNEYEELVPVTKEYSSSAFALRVLDDSMYATAGASFPDGSIICVEPMQQAENRSYIVVRLDGRREATFKQLVVDGHRRYLKPLNQRYPIMEATDDTTVFGVVLQIMMNFDR